MRINRRRTEKKVKDRYIRIATDYNAGFKIREIMVRNKCSKQTVYNAINFVVKGVK
jgi:DNA invertase Pin-like site-specific DNA recombinase